MSRRRGPRRKTPARRRAPRPTETRPRAPPQERQAPPLSTAAVARGRQSQPWRGNHYPKTTRETEGPAPAR
eukprot:11206083-Lingulodinium_polyedra.AAC.1